MNWGIFIQDLPESAKTTEEISSDFKPQPIGKRDDVIRKIKTVIPHADFSDPSLGIIEDKGYSIEIAIGEQIVQSITLFVRGDSSVLEIIRIILKALKLRAIVAGTKYIFDHTSLSVDTFKEWRDYRNQIVDS